MLEDEVIMLEGERVVKVMLEDEIKYRYNMMGRETLVVLCSLLYCSVNY